MSQGSNESEDFYKIASEYFEANATHSPSNLKKLAIDLREGGGSHVTNVMGQFESLEEETSRTLEELMNPDAVAVGRRAVALNKDLFTLSRTRQMATGLMPRSKEQHMADKVRERSTAAQIKVMMNLRNFTLQDTHGYRVRAAYRLVRYMSYIRGDFDAKGRMTEAIALKHSIPQPFDPDGVLLAGTDGIRQLLMEWTMSPDATVTQISRDGRKIDVAYGPSYLPPPVPDAFYRRDLEDNDIPPTTENIAVLRSSAPVPNSYIPDEDAALNYFIYTYSLIADFLDIYDGTALEPDAGALGMAGLLHPNSARTAWPSINDLSLFEYELCNYVYEMETSAEAGEKGTVTRLQEEFGYTPFEAKEIRKMAIAQGEIENALDENQSRILLIEKTSKMAAAAQQNMQYRDALAALKQEAQLRKLNQNDQNDSWAELKSMVTAASMQNLLD